MESISLSLSLFPKNISKEQWYIKATILAEKIRDEKFMIEQKNWGNLSEKIKKKNPKIVQQIKDESINSLQFCRFILNKYPYPDLEMVDVDSVYKLIITILKD